MMALSLSLSHARFSSFAILLFPSSSIRVSLVFLYHNYCIIVNALLIITLSLSSLSSTELSGGNTLLSTRCGLRSIRRFDRFSRWRVSCETATTS